MLGFGIDDADRIAERAGILGLSAQRERYARHLIDDGHGVVAGDDLGFHQIGRGKRLARPQRVPRREPDRGVAVGEHGAAFCLGPPHRREIGCLQHFAAFDRTIDRDGADGLDGGAGIARRLPLQRHAIGHIERHVEARRARIIGQRQYPQLAGGIGLDLQRAHVAVEIDQDVACIAEAVLPGQRLSDPGGDFTCRDGAAGAGHDDFGEAVGVDADELVRPDGVENAIGCHRAGGAEIGGAENRHVGDWPGIFDQIADGDDIAGDGDVGLERRHRRG